MYLRPLAYSSLVVFVGLVGCSSSSETFSGRPADQVWTAMVKTAENPEYTDWHVIENDVWADEGSGRIEIWRLLRRYVDPASQWARLENQEWKFSIRLEPTDPPTATFEVRSLGIPSHSWGESGRYFDQVWKLLGGRPVEPREAMQVDPATKGSDVTSQSQPPATPETPTSPPSSPPMNDPPVDIPSAESMN